MLDVDQDRILSILSSIDLLSEALVGREALDLEIPIAEHEVFRLVAEVAHDLRSPLTSILFLSEATP